MSTNNHEVSDFTPVKAVSDVSALTAMAQDVWSRSGKEQRALNASVTVKGGLSQDEMEEMFFNSLTKIDHNILKPIENNVVKPIEDNVVKPILNFFGAGAEKEQPAQTPEPAQKPEHPAQTPDRPDHPAQTPETQKPNDVGVLKQLADQIQRSLGDTLQVLTQHDSKIENTEKGSDKVSLNDKAAEDAIRHDASYVARIIMADGDFESGLKRERIQTAFEEATKRGPEELKRFVEMVNAELKKAGSEMELVCSYGSAPVDYVRDAGNRDIYYRPEQFSDPRSTITLKNTRTGEAEDRIDCSINPERPGYIRLEPKGRPSSRANLKVNE